MNKFQLITNEVKKVINGKDRAVVTTLLALLTGGNILIEDIPGVGKTTMAVAFSKALGLEYGRVQFTPDTLPSDITGFAVYNKDTGKFTFNKGAVFCNLFLADELNRTSSRTQAALLEAMEERQVTVEGNTFKLEKPFSVIATQNPTGASGTQLLPDSQIDRFTVRLSMGYPDSDAECKMLLNRSGKNPLNSVNCIVSKNEFLEMQSEVQNVFVSDDMARYIVSLISATRKHPLLSRGASPRATLSLTDMAKAVGVTALRNSMLRAGVFKNEKTAEEQVVQVLNFDIHLQKDFRGRRYIERVTECIPIVDKKTYDYDYNSEKTMNGKVQKFFENATTYFSKVTEQNLYRYQNVLEYVDGEYQITNKITDKNLAEMRANMDESDLGEFDAFVEKYWGDQIKKERKVSAKAEK